MAGNGPQVLCGSHRFDPFRVWRDPIPKPVVMAVNGIAFTLSIELALAADIVIAADDVRFRQLRHHAVRRGHLPRARAAGLGQRDALPAHREEFGAAEALRIGLVQEVVPSGAHVQRYCRTAVLPSVHGSP